MSEKGTNGKPSSKNKSSSKNPTPGNSTGISNNEYEELAKMEHNEGLGLAATGATVVVGGIVLAAGATAAAPIAVGVVLVGVGGTLVAVGIQKIQFAKDAFKFYAATDED